MIDQGYTSFRMRDIIFMQNNSAYSLFKKYGKELDILVAIPAMDYNRDDVKLYIFSLADNPDAWAQCEYHFGIWDLEGARKCEF